jgi:hypothetical protein
MEEKKNKQTNNNNKKKACPLTLQVGEKERCSFFPLWKNSA